MLWLSKSTNFQLYIITMKQYLIEQNLLGFCSNFMQKRRLKLNGEDINRNLRRYCGGNRGNHKGGLKKW